MNFNKSTALGAHQQLYINGSWVDSDCQDSCDIINPANGECISSVQESNINDVNKAVTAARNALSSWSATTGAERAKFLEKLIEKIQSREQELTTAISLELGMPRHLTLEIQVRSPIDGVKPYIQHAIDMDQNESIGNSIIVKEAIGVCALICPWNYPLYQLLAKVAPAIAAGCTMVVKPSMEAPLSAFILADIFSEIGLPAGVFNLITGSGSEVGKALCSHSQIDMVSFTGSTKTGIQVAKASSNTVKRICQELGGKSPLIITENADIEAAVQFGIQDIMINSGQTCTALSRMLIPAKHYDRAVICAKKFAEDLLVGDPQNDSMYLGPVVSSQQWHSVIAHIKQGISEGARLVTGGTNKPTGLEHGFYIKPTIFADVTNDMAIAQEEIFGPVLCMISYDSDEEAINIANDTAFGLSAAVWAGTKDQAIKIAQKIKAGQVAVNGGEFNYLAPFGGYKQSGNGREWGIHGLSEFTETKSIQH